MTLLALTLTATATAGTRQDVARDLNRGLRGTAMHGQGWRLEAVGHRTGISPYFIALAAGRESSFGNHGCHGNPKNVWGLKSCALGSYVDLNGDGHPESIPRFRTWGHAFTFFAAYINARFPHARTAWDFHGYCGCGVSSWAGGIDRIARRLGWPTGVRYAR